MDAASALVQELAFRGDCFQNLTERLPTRTAVVVGGLTVAVLHLPGDGLSPLLGLVVVADLTLMACSRWTPPPGPTTATRWSAPASRTCCLAPGRGGVAVRADLRAVAGRLLAGHPAAPRGRPGRLSCPGAAPPEPEDGPHGGCRQRAAGAVGAEHRAEDPAPGTRRAGRWGGPAASIARWCMLGGRLASEAPTFNAHLWVMARSRGVRTVLPAHA